MNIADKLLEFRRKQNTALLISHHQADIENLNVIAIELLAWLKLEHKRALWISQGRKTTLKPLELNYNYPWCNELKAYIQDEPVFANVFSIEGKYLNFKDELPDSYKNETRRTAFDNYNPGMITG